MYKVPIIGRGAFSIEKCVHKFYNSKRISGEWFDLTEDDIQFLHDDIRNIIEVFEDSNPEIFDFVSSTTLLSLAGISIDDVYRHWSTASLVYCEELCDALE